MTPARNAPESTTFSEGTAQASHLTARWGWGLLALLLLAALGSLTFNKADAGRESWTDLDDGLLKPWVRGQNAAVEEPAPAKLFTRYAAPRTPSERTPAVAEWASSGQRQGFGPTKSPKTDATHSNAAAAPRPFAAPAATVTATPVADDPFSMPGRSESQAEPRREAMQERQVRRPVRQDGDSLSTSLFQSEEPESSQRAPEQAEESDPFALPGTAPTTAPPTPALSAPPQAETGSPDVPGRFIPLQPTEMRPIESNADIPESQNELRLIPGEIRPVAGEQGQGVEIEEPDPFAANAPAAMPIAPASASEGTAGTLPAFEPTPFPGGPLTPPDDVQIEATPALPLQPDPSASPLRFPESQPAPKAVPSPKPAAHIEPKGKPHESYSPRPAARSQQPVLTTPGTDEVNEDVYQVQNGDNYWTISRRFYGTARFFGALAEYNRHRISDPEKMRPGMYVLVPDVEVLHRRYPELTGGGRSGPANPEDLIEGFFVDTEGRPVYRVGKGVTLTDIAQRHLGRATRWVEIYRLNKDQIPDVKTLKIGAVLLLPADACQVRLAPAD